jgi:hypothetical protein
LYDHIVTFQHLSERGGVFYLELHLVHEGVPCVGGDHLCGYASARTLGAGHDDPGVGC